MKKWMLNILAIVLVAVLSTNFCQTLFIGIKNEYMRQKVANGGEGYITQVVNSPYSTTSTTATVTEYVNDIRIGWSQNNKAQGSIDAKKQLTDNGYKVVDNDLNSGTGEGWAYLGYTTTTDVNDAITDIAMMDMKGGYEMSNLGETEKKYDQSISSLANGMKTAADEFRANYDKGSPAADLAYKTLNLIKVNAHKSADATIPEQKLGEYIISQNQARSESDFKNIILKCNPNILQFIYEQITFGVVDYDVPNAAEPKGTWIERLSKINFAESDYDANTQFAKAEILYNAFETFALNNAAAQEALEKAQIDPTYKVKPENVLTETIREILSGYTAQEKYSDDESYPINLGDYLTNEYISISQLFPVADAFTPGQLAMVSISGIEAFAIHLAATKIEGNSNPTSEQKEAARAKTYADAYIKVQAESGALAGLELWAGVNLDAYKEDEQIAITNDAYRKMASEGDYSAFTKTNTMRDNVSQSLTLVGAIAGVFFAVASIAWGVAASTFGATFAFATIVPTIGAVFATTAGGAVVASTFVAGVVGLIVAIVILLILVFIIIADEIKKCYEYYHPTYTAIPGQMYDLVEMSDWESKYIKYEAVKTVKQTHADGTPEFADLNTWKGLEWNALYVTKDPDAGVPITADFLVQYGNPNVPEGYSPMHEFGSVTAANTNKNTYKDSQRGNFLFFRTDGENTAKQEGRYLSDVIIEEEETAEGAAGKIEARGFNVLRFNLLYTGHLSGYAARRTAYIGYKTTNNPDNALRDLRLGTNLDVSGIQIGDASYGKCGTYNKVDDMYSTTLFQSSFKYTDKSKNCWPPLLAEFYTNNDANKKPPLGFEPITHIAGGPAINMNVGMYQDSIAAAPRKYGKTFVYVKSSVDYSANPDYISGIGFSKTYKENIVNNVLKENGYTPLGQEIDFDYDFSIPTEQSMRKGAIGYSTTKNPFKALKKVMVANINNSGVTMPSYTVSGGIGYAAAPSFFTDIDNRGGTRREIYGVSKSNAFVDGSWKAKQSTSMYLAGGLMDGEPLTLGDMIFSNKTLDKASEGYVPVSELSDYSFTPFNIKQGSQSKDELYMYVKGKNTTFKYVSNIIAGGSEGGEAYAKLDLFSQNADQSLNYYSEGKFYDTLDASPKLKNHYASLGLQRHDNYNEAIRGVKFVPYLEASSKKLPPLTMVFDGITYDRATKTPVIIFQKNLDLVGYERENIGLYAYVSKNPALGSPITDLKINSTKFESGYENAEVLQNVEYTKYGLYDYANIPTIHIKREVSSTKYIGSIRLGAIA